MLLVFQNLKYCIVIVIWSFVHLFAYSIAIGLLYSAYLHIEMWLVFSLVHLFNHIADRALLRYKFILNDKFLMQHLCRTKA